MLLKLADTETPDELTEEEGSPEVRFTYSRPEQPFADRILIRAVEWLSGAHKLEGIYREWAETRPADENFFDAALQLLGVKVDVKGLEKVPADGPVLFITNHPFGVIDGLSLGQIANRARGDIKIMTHSRLCAVPEAREHLLPVDFAGTADAQRTNIETRKQAVEWLLSGKSLGVFPAGGVATAQKPFTGPALESPWHPFTAKLAALPGVRVVPVYFHGCNSRLFHIASHIAYPLRISLLFRETMGMRGRTVQATIGEPLTIGRACANRGEIVRTMRRATIGLGPKRVDPDAEFVFPRYIKVD